MKTPPKSEIEVSEILAAEYEYIAQTAFQAHEDRSRVISFYVVSLGSLFGAFISTGLFEKTLSQIPFAYLAFAGLFVFLSIFGYITLLQLIYLRLAWFDSIAAMNQIKAFLIEKDKNLGNAFKWLANDVPKKFKTNSVAFLMAIQVASLGAITAGASIFYFARNINPNPDEASQKLHILLALIVSITSFTFQLLDYRRRLR